MTASTKRARRGKAGIEEALNNDETKPVIGMTEEDVETELEKLWALRAGIAHAPSKLEVPEWTVRVLGGGWLQTHRGKAFDAFRAAPSVGSEAEAWAESAGFGRSARFATDLYGVLEAKLLCGACANKCQFY